MFVQIFAGERQRQVGACVKGAWTSDGVLAVCKWGKLAWKLKNCRHKHVGGKKNNAKRMMMFQCKWGVIGLESKRENNGPINMLCWASKNKL